MLISNIIINGSIIINSNIIIGNVISNSDITISSNKRVIAITTLP